MRIIICGAGQVGSSIAKQLADEHNDVVVIDISPELVDRIATSLDVQGIVGYASHPDVLEAAGAPTADMIIAATLSDEVNMIACQVAHSLFDVPTKIARIRTQDYLHPIWRDLFSQDHMPIDVIISPEHEVARAIMRRIDAPGAFEVVPFADEQLLVLGISITEDCPIIETPLEQLTELFPELNIRVLGINRDNRTIVPSPGDMILPGDDVYVVTETGQRARALSAFGHDEPEARRIIIVGGGNVGLVLAQYLEEHPSSTNVKIIEASVERAEQIADELNGTIILHGDALDSEILLEAGVDVADMLIAVANDDEVNILSSLLAKREGADRVFTLVNNRAYGPLMASLGVDVYIDPRATTVSTILQHVRRGRIRGLHSLVGAKAELIEAEALETLDILDTPLRDMNIPDGILFGAFVRGEDVIIPTGNTVIKAGDRVVIFALAEQIKRVEQMFSVQLEYF